MTNKYCFVLDYDGKPLSPTKENKGWFLIRKGRATLEKKYPMTIRLNKRVEDKDLDIEEYIVKPIRRKSKGKVSNVCGFKYRDFVSFTNTKKEKHRGYINALYPSKGTYGSVKFTSIINSKRITSSVKKTTLLWRFTNIYWLEGVNKV